MSNTKKDPRVIEPGVYVVNTDNEVIDKMRRDLVQIGYKFESSGPAHLKITYEGD